MKLNKPTPALFVGDAMKAGEFYTKVLGMTIAANYGDANLIFEEGFTLWQVGDDNEIAQVFGKAKIDDPAAAPRGELYFDTEDFDAVFEILKEYGVKFLHEIITEAWGQRNFRFFDPDGHLIEIGEAMPIFLRRVYEEEGHDAEAAAKRSFMSEKDFREVLGI